MSGKFNQVEGEFLEFDRIPAAEKRHPRKDICAFIYLHEIIGGKGSTEIISGAEHDVVYLDCDNEKAEAFSVEQITYLTRCGVREGEYGLEMFV